MAIDFEIFEGKSLSDVFKDIYDNSKRNKEQLEVLMKEVVGSQDQTSASFGGFNKIIFNKNNSINVKRISSNKNLKKLNDNLYISNPLKKQRFCAPGRPGEENQRFSIKIKNRLEADTKN